jgi:hypothetical protein
MKSEPLGKIFNFVWYQSLWFLAVLGREESITAITVLLAAHLWFIKGWRSEIVLMGTTGIIGICLDGALKQLGFYQFDAPPEWLPVPLWLIGIWMGFAATLRFGLSWLVAKPWIMAAMSAIGAPLTYFAAARLGAVTFPLGTIPTALAVGIGWLLVTPLLGSLVVWCNRLESAINNDSREEFIREVGNA